MTMTKLHLLLSLALPRFRIDRRGATSIEYGLIAGILSIAIVVGVNAAGAQVLVLFQRVLNAIMSVS
jgi:pilus assembly protein Flp/PilA